MTCALLDILTLNKRGLDQVEVDLGLSAHANAAEHYGQRKKSALKQQKTLDSSVKVCVAQIITVQDPHPFLSHIGYKHIACAQCSSLAW